MKPCLPFSPILALGLTLAACTRPAGEPPPDTIATLVAATLTAAPTLPPTNTPPPSATPILTPSSTPTETSTPGPSPSPTPPELPPDDPRYGLNLATPHYQDNFSSQFTWFGPSFEGALNIWEDGRLQATDYLTDQSIWWSTTVRDIDAGNLYVEITSEIGECSGKDGFGIAVRVNGDIRNSGYTLEFSCDGAYRIRKFTTGSVEILVDWTASDAIQSGTGSINRMGFLAKADQLIAFANGELIGQVEDYSFFAGTFGLFASAAETPGLTVFFDDFALWYVTL
jgi:hypothetical protein